MTFEEFTAERLPAVLRFAGVLTGDRALAEDVVQEVLIRAHGRWKRISRLDRPELYVRKMVVNQFLSWRRRSWRLVPSGSGSDIDHRRTPDHALHYAERDALLGELGKLPGLAARRADAAVLRGTLRLRDRAGTRLHARHRARLRVAGAGRAARRADAAT